MTTFRRVLATAAATLPIAAAGAAALPASASAAKRLVISGAGWGHGVGLSQWGAEGMAQHGWEYDRILAHYYRGTEIVRAPTSSVVRVLLATGRTIAFSGATRAGRAALRAGTVYRAQLSGSTVAIRGGGRSFRVAQGTRISGPGPVKLGVLGEYRGWFELRAAEDAPAGHLQAVNAVLLEDYVRGVVPGESYAGSWQMETLKAQAVAARGYAITTNKGGTYDQFADTRSQVYDGVDGEHPRANQAIAATRGEVVAYDGEPITTYFHSSSGGHTEDSSNVWGGERRPYLVGVRDPYDDVPGNSRHRWTVTMSLASAEAKLSGYVRGRLRAIRVVETGASPRILRAQVVGTGGSTTIRGSTLKERFGLNETWARFVVKG